MNSDTIEKTAVAAVKEEIRRYEELQDFILENDKMPSYDGQIFVYETKHRSKRIVGIIQVQVKGKKVSSFSADKITYSIDVCDLRNYFANGGVILFVVEIIDYRTTKTYYSSLLPLDLKDIVDKLKPDQEKKSVLLEYISSIPASFYDVCRQFVEDEKKQRSTIQYVTEELDAYEKMEFSIVADPNIDIEKKVLSMPVYLYGIRSSNNPSIPIRKVQFVEIQHEIEREIYIDNEIYFNKYIVSKTINNEVIHIGDCFKFNVAEHKITYEPKGRLRKRIRDFEFILKVFDKKYFNVGNLRVNMPEVDNNILMSLIERKKFLDDTISLLSYYGIVKDLNLDDFSDEDFNNLNMLIHASLYGYNIHSELVKSVGFSTVNIHSLRILVFYLKNSDGNYRIYNPNDELDQKVKFVIEQADGTKQSHTSLVNLKEEHLLADNIDPDYFSSFIINDLYSPEFSVYVNNYVLELLKAFDMCHRTHMLDAALRIAEKLLDSEPMSGIYLVNKYQIIKRKRTLKKEEKKILFELKQSCIDNYALLCAVNILLRDNSEAIIAYDRMNADDKETFKSYPIYSLWK